MNKINWNFDNTYFDLSNSFKENINYLNSIKELVQLEHEYLSSPAKLSELNKLYFFDSP